jgi:hypothetical protein
MKPRLFAFLLLLSACTCNTKKQEGNTADTSTSNQPASFADRLGTFKTYIAQQDSTIAENSALATQKYKSLFDGADSASADSAFVLFYNFHQKITDNLNDQLVKDTIDYRRYVLDTSASVLQQNAKAKTFIEKLLRNGFRLAIAEGSAYIMPDFTFYVQQFLPFISNTMQSYLQQQIKEQKEGFMVDGALQVQPSALADRIVYWKTFLQQHPSFSFNAAINAKQVEYTTFLLEGVDNMPLFDHQTQKLSAAYKDAYEHVLSEYPLSQLSAIIKPYYAALSKGDVKQQKELLSSFRKQGLILDFTD